MTHKEMVEKASKILDEIGHLTVPMLCYKIPCSREIALEILNLLCPNDKFDHSLPLEQFIEKYRHRFVIDRKIRLSSF